MYRLERVSLHNWNTIEAEDIELRGATGLVGPTGVGKSSILDAIQAVVAGASLRSLNLNASTEGKSERSLREYCLGYVDDIGPEPLRERCESTLVLSFRDTGTGNAVAVGLMLAADVAELRERLSARFIVHGLAFRLADFQETGRDGHTYVLSHAEMIERLNNDRRCKLEPYNVSAKKFVEAYLQAMRRRGAVPNAEHFLKNFKNMVAFSPVGDATDFVRRYILAPDRLDVDRIRDSIDHWRSMEAEVQRLQAMLTAIQDVRRRFLTWARQKVEHNALLFSAAYCERRRLESLRERDREKLDDLRGKLENARAAKDRHEAEIKAIDETIIQKRALMADSTAGAKIEAIDGRIREARREEQDAANAIAQRFGHARALARFDAVRDCVPTTLAGAISAAQTLVGMARMELGDLTGRESEIAELDRQARTLLGARHALQANQDRLVEEIAKASREIEDLEAQVADAGTGGAVLSRPVRRLIDLLKHAGIEAAPLPDLVEIADDRWAYALEALLGANREALIVDPIHQHKAHELLFQNRRELSSCRLVQTRRMDRVDPKAEPGSLATIVTPVGDHGAYVRKFIDHLVGRYRMVETREELDAHSNAVMPDGKTSSGLTLRVHGDLRLILGKTARSRAIEETRRQIDDLKARLGDWRAQKQRIESALDALRRIEDDATPDFAACFEAVANARARIASAEADRRTVEDPETARLREEVAELETAKAAYAQELAEEIGPEIETLTREERKIDVEVQGYDRQIDAQQEHERQAVDAEAEMAELTAYLDRPVDIDAMRAKVESSVLHAGDDWRGRLAQLRNAAQEQARDLRPHLQDNERRAQTAFHKFLRDYDIDSELGEDARHETMLAWVALRECKLEENELRPYKEKVEDARRSMEAALKEDLLNKLSDKFKMLKLQLRTLNNRLEKHRFTGMKYSFSEQVDPRLSRLHHLAQAIADSPEHGLEGHADSGSRAFQEAMQQIEDILDRNNDTTLLEDYRNYYTFELIMEGGDGVRTNLSRRTKKGSGGQKQAPYYVAIAAAMASVYYPNSRSEDPDGMGLVLFDEAFNRLDIPNTQAILKFYEDLNLQVVVAAPEEKRMSFLEVMNTIVSVNKLPGDSVMYIDTEHPQRKALEAMQAANPEHLGVEGYRRRLEADAAGAAESDAAE